MGGKVSSPSHCHRSNNTSFSVVVKQTDCVSNHLFVITPLLLSIVVLSRNCRCSCFYKVCFVNLPPIWLFSIHRERKKRCPTANTIIVFPTPSSTHGSCGWPSFFWSACIRAFLRTAGFIPTWCIIRSTRNQHLFFSSLKTRSSPLRIPCNGLLVWTRHAHTHKTNVPVNLVDQAF